MTGQIYISDTFKFLYLTIKITSEHRSEIRVSEICIDLQDPDQLSLFPDAGKLRMGIMRICR